MNLDQLSGLITPEVGEFLASVARQVPADLAIVEIGSFRGMSTCYLASGARDGNGAKVWAVDPWDLPGNPYGKHGYSAPIVREEFERQLRGLQLWSRVNPVQDFSTSAAAAWTGPKIGLLFIDGDHDESAVRSDIEQWSPHLAESHLVVLDDLDTPRNPGVRVVADELADAGWLFEKAADRLAVLCRS